jgi:O-methyltransferase domain
MQEAQIVHEHLYAMWQARCIQAAAEFGIAEHLKDGPRSTHDLATITHPHEPSLYRLLRALASEGFFAEIEPGVFAKTSLSTYLRPDVPGSLYHMALYPASETVWHEWGALSYSIRTGQPAFEAIYKMPVWQYYDAHPEAGAVFDKAMTDFSLLINHAIVSAYDFSAVSTIVDVGGGHGSLLNAILTAYPQIERGVLFDQPAVIQQVSAHGTKLHLDSRCQVVAGNFFEEVPAGGDLYVLKEILHDWSDEEAITILRNCRQALSPQSKVLVSEQLILPEEQGKFARLLDLHMLVEQRGRERAQEEFSALYEAAGLKLSRVIPTHSPHWLLEGLPL